jgi:enamine deaminase RidA (YjgF/YER057c/UK114 family)
MSTNAEARLAELNIELPPAPKAIGMYKPIVVSGNTAYLSGHLPLNSDGSAKPHLPFCYLSCIAVSLTCGS